MTTALDAHRAAAPWAQSASGRAVALIDCDPASISVRDVAAHLAKICRFAGATTTFYSVAQHSVLVATLLREHGPRAAMYGLLHDAHEAYIGDITQPAKLAVAARLLPGVINPLDDLADRIDRAVFRAAGLAWPITPAVLTQHLRHADLRALATEKRDLMVDGPQWSELPAAWRSVIKPWPWAKAEERFLDLYRELAALARTEAMPGFTT